MTKHFDPKNFDMNEFVKSVYGLDSFEIEKLDFDSDKRTLGVYAKLPLKECFCKKCEGKFTEVHDWQDQKARMPPFGNYLDVTLFLKKPRGHCGNCLSVQSPKIFFSTQHSHPWFADLQSIVGG
jgi:transposase